MADDLGKKTHGRLSKLVAELREYQAKTYELTEEINKLLNGEAGVGDRMKHLEQTFSRLWEARYHTLYVWAYTRDRPAIKRLLKLLEEAEIERRMLSYLRNYDPFYVKARHSFSVFVASINAHAADRPGAGKDSPVVGDCRHVPMCGTDQVHTTKKAREMRGE